MIETKKLAQAIKLLKTTTSKRSTLPVLSGTLLQHEGTKVRATSYDLLVGSSVDIELAKEHQTKEPWATVIPTKLLAKLARSKYITLDMKPSEDGKTLEVSTGGVLPTSHSIPTLPANEFVKLPQAPTKAFSMTADAHKFVEAFRRVSHAISIDQSKPILCTAFLRFTRDPDRVQFIAIDTHRMCVVEGPPTRYTGKLPEFDVLLPFELLKPLQAAKSFTGPGGLATVTVGDQNVWIIIGAATVASGLIDREYPNWRRVLDKPRSREMVVNARDLLETCQHLDEWSDLGRARFHFNSGGLKIEVELYDEGTTSAVIMGEGEGPEGGWIGLSVRYVADAIRELPKEAIVEIHSETNADSVTFTSAQVPGWAEVIMPIKATSFEGPVK